MRLAVISDIHGNHAALKAVIHDMEEQQIDRVLFLGDLVMLGPEPQGSLDIIKELKPACWLKGNTDTWFEEMSGGWTPSNEKEQELYEYYQYATSRLSNADIELIIDRPVTDTVEYMGKHILCVHGSPRAINEIMDGRVPKESLDQMAEGVKEDIIICGHSHVPYNGRHKGRYIFNVGSVGKPFDGDVRASYGIIELSPDVEPKFVHRRVSYSLSEVLKLAREREFPRLEKFEAILSAAAIQ
jgi:putative phosphoesterase